MSYFPIRCQVYSSKKEEDSRGEHIKMKRKTLKNLVVDFCVQKHNILLDITGLELYTPSDFEYISLLKKKEYINFLDGLKNRKPFNESDDDTISCIYCSIHSLGYSTDCDKCFYGLYHGKCSIDTDDHNTYKLILDKLNGYYSFSAIPAIIKLEKYYVEMYKVLLMTEESNSCI